MLRAIARQSWRQQARAGWRPAGVRHASKWRNESKTDDKIEIKWFLLVGVFGTMVYATVMQRIQEQDHSKNVEKYKKTFTEEEWAKYENDTKTKKLTLASGEECFLVPFTHHNTVDSKVIKSTVEKLGGSSSVGVLDLNSLVKKQLEDDSSSCKYHNLLTQSLESKDETSEGFQYAFSYKLKPGLFTQMVSDEILRLKDEDYSIGRFLILNYPPTIKEAVKFEQNICNKDTVLTLKDTQSDIIEYFDTVEKVKSVSALSKMQPLKITDMPTTTPVDTQPKLHVLATQLSEDAPAIEKAQHQLRALGQPIREYGESDVDVINRLKSFK